MALTNPYLSGSDNHVDFEIWNNGVDRFNDPKRRYARGTRQPHELDYLRGFHDPATLGAIRARIAAVTGRIVNVTSFWLDKTAYVFPKTSGVSTSRRELADLAVVLRDFEQRNHAMWILQAKKGDNAASPLARGGSTAKEIELFEMAPQFELEPLSRTTTNLAFDLEPEFGTPTNSADFRHWSFLIFRETPTAPTACDPSPAQWRWNGSGPKPQTGSFMNGVTEMLLSPTNPLHKGAELLPAGIPTGWKGLHDALMSHVPSSALLGHAGKPMRITAFSPAAPLCWQIGSNCFFERLPRDFYLFGNDFMHPWPPAFKFDMISTGPGGDPELQNWKMRMSDSDFWKGVEQAISESVDRAIDAEIPDDQHPRDGSSDFAGDGRWPPGDETGGEGGNGAHPVRATLVIDIGRQHSA